MRLRSRLVIVLSTLFGALLIYSAFRHGLTYSYSGLSGQSNIHEGLAVNPSVTEQVTIHLEPVLEQRLGRSTIQVQEVEYNADDLVIGLSDRGEYLGYDTRSKTMRFITRETPEAPPGLTQSDAITKEVAISLLEQICADFGITYEVESEALRFEDAYDRVANDLFGCSWMWRKRHQIGDYEVLDRGVRIEISAYDGALSFFNNTPIGPLPNEAGKPIGQEEAVDVIRKERQVADIVLHSGMIGYIYNIETPKNQWLRIEEPPHLVWSLAFKGESCRWNVEALEIQFVKERCFE